MSQDRERDGLGAGEPSSQSEPSLPEMLPSESFPESWSWRNSSCPPGAAVVVDMDGVISNAGARQHYLNNPPKDWHSFFNACDQDPPILATTTLLHQLDSDLLVILLTARPSWVRQKTLQWLDKHNPRWDLLILRSPAEDKLSAGEYKLRSLRELQQRGFDLRVGFEDDPKNVTLFSDFGLPCVYIHSGYYEDKKGRSPMG